MAIGTIAAILGATAIAGAAAGTTAVISKSKSNSGGSGGAAPEPNPLPLPQAPKPEATAEKAQETMKKKRVAQTRSVYTSPLGVGGEADIARKTLTGQ